DPRQFSYDAHWHPAAGQLSRVRVPLAPWIATGAVLDEVEDAQDEVPLETLRRFLLAPAEQFLRHRLGLRLPEIEDAGEDIEPLRAPSGGLERHQLQHAVFDALLAGESEDAMCARLRARGLLPAGSVGRRVLLVELGRGASYA